MIYLIGIIFSFLFYFLYIYYNIYIYIVFLYKTFDEINKIL